jgi:hypothetical protein
VNEGMNVGAKVLKVEGVAVPTKQQQRIIITTIIVMITLNKQIAQRKLKKVFQKQKINKCI